MDGRLSPWVEFPLTPSGNWLGLHAEGHHQAAENSAKQRVAFWSCLELLLSGQQVTRHWHIVFIKQSPGCNYRGRQGSKDGREVSNGVSSSWHQPLTMTPKTTGKLREEVDLCRGYPGPTDRKGQRGYL